MSAKKRIASALRVSSVMDLFDVGPAAAVSVIVAVLMVATFAVVFFIRSAPPDEITITTGPEGGVFQKTAMKYAKVLETNGVRLKIVTSQGSNQNLQRLKDKASGFDVGMVQAGIAEAEGNDDLISLGSISQQPILLFYRGNKLDLLSDLKNKKIGLGPEGSGANLLAKKLLSMNGIKDNDGTTLLAVEGEEASKMLEAKKLDAAFIMSESTAFATLKALLHSKEIHLYSYKQANAYVRKLDYLNALNMPQGVIDFGENLPSSDVSLIGPMVDLIAKKDLHPAVSDLLLEAATQIHNRPGFYQQRGDFPAAVEHNIKISDDASRYYKSGKSFLYRFLPYWMASLLSRILVVFVPAFVILIPAIRLILSFFKWRVKIKIYQRYRELVALEQQFLSEPDPKKQSDLRRDFDRIEESVYKMRIKGSYADQIYGLRGHIDYVRRLVGQRQG